MRVYIMEEDGIWYSDGTFLLGFFFSEIKRIDNFLMRIYIYIYIFVIGIYFIIQGKVICIDV